MDFQKRKKEECLVRSKLNKNFAYLAFGFGIFWLGWGLYIFSVISVFPIALGTIFIFAGRWELKKISLIKGRMR